MPDVRYTDTITVCVESSTITDDNLIQGRAEFEVTAPRSAWWAHPTVSFLIEDADAGAGPWFFLPAPDPALPLAHHYALRGGLESLAENSWSAREALLQAGLDERIADLALPGHHMVTRYVTVGALPLARFIESQPGYTVGSEIVIIASGYAAHLAEAAPDFYAAHQSLTRKV